MSQKAGIILVVDDEREHADGIAESLEKLCSKAIAVYNGKDAIEILHSQQIDIVVTDLKLNDKFDGLDVLTEAKKQNDQTEVILITAYATIDTCKEAIKQGAFDYLVKPIDIDQLRTLVIQASQKAKKNKRQRTASQGCFLLRGSPGRKSYHEGYFRSSQAGCTN